MTNLSTKYLDLSGLQNFWLKAKEYIDSQDTSIFEKLNAVNQQLTELYDAVIGDGGSIETAGGTLGERLTAVEGYVQKVDVENPNTGTKYVTVSVTDDTNTSEQNKGKQTKITIDDSALTEKIASIDAISHVNSIDGQSGIITVDKNNQDAWAVNFEVGDDKKLTGEVVAPDHLGIEDIQTSVGTGVDRYLTLTENEVNGVSTITLGGTLDETIDTLKGYVQEVDVENPNTGTKYVTVSVTDDTDNNETNGKQTKITIDDSALTEKIASLDAISHVNSIDGQSGVVTVDKNATDPWSVNFEVGDDKKLTGEVVAPDHLGIEDIQTSVSAGVDGYLTLTENEVDGVSTITLGGTLDETIDTLKGYVQDVEAENPNTGTKYVTVSVTDDTNTNTGSDGKQTKIAIDDSALTEKISDIENNIEDNYTKTEDLPKKLPNPHKFTLTYRDKENQENVVEYDGSSAKDVDFSLYHATTSTTATRVSNSLKVVDANGNAYDYNGGVMVDLSDGINYAAEAGNADTLDNHDSTYFAVASTVNGQIQDILDTIAGLGQVVELKGILDTLPATTEGYGNGDVVIVTATNEGDLNGTKKEYICFEGKWYLLGYTDEISEKVEELESNFDNYLPLSGGTLTGNLTAKQITIDSGNWLVTYGPGISLQRTDGPSYIWNTTSKSIAIGTSSVGQLSELNASLVINGTNIYPGTSNKFSLGTDSLKFKDIFADGKVVGGRFLTGTKTKAVLESDTNSGLSIATQIPLNGSTAGDYGFNTTNNANGVLAFRTHAGSGFNYMHYLGFSNDGEIYHTAQNAQFAGWRNLTNPFGSILMPRTIDTVNSRAVIPSILNEGIVNIFNYPLKSELLIERSQDGSTWIDVTEDEYENFRRGFTKGYNQGGNRYVAYDKTNGQVGDRLRITYIPNNRYCSMGYLDVYYTTSGATTSFTFELNNKNDESTWVKVHDSKPCTGWPGHNYYGLSGYNFGQTNGSNYYACRMTFEITAISSSSNNLGAINYIYGFTAQTPYSTSRSDSCFRYDVALQACRNTGHIIPTSTGYELGNQQFPFKNIITQSLAISLGSGHTPNYITSDNNRNMFIKIADVIPFVVDCADTNNPVIRPSISMGSKVNLGTTGQPWRNVYASKFVTTGGTASQVVLGDGTLKAISDISTGGEANVQSDWNVTDTTSDAYIKNKPTSLKNPYSLTIQKNGTDVATYDGSVAKTVNITPASIGAAASPVTYRIQGTETGFYKISINSTALWMLAFRVRVYSSYKYYDIRFSGYNYNTDYWYSAKSSLVEGDASVDTYFGYDDVNQLWVAIPAGNFTGIEIADCVNGYASTGKSLSELFTITRVDSLSGTIQHTYTIYPTSKKNHTHTVPKTGTTALVASKSDHSHTASSGGPSVSYSATTGVLTITMNHTHTVPADTENVISVASQEHTHTTGQA